LLLLLEQAGPGGLVAVPDSPGLVPTGCVLDLLGVRLTHIGQARARAEMVVATAHLNQRGTTQGGVFGVLADATAGWASDAALTSGSYTTLEFKGNLVGAAPPGSRLVAEARPVHVGRRTLVHNVDVWSQTDTEGTPPRLVAFFTCTQLVL
jgi:uncharacterized protein (TIGR00369 family)